MASTNWNFAPQGLPLARCHFELRTSGQLTFERKAWEIANEENSMPVRVLTDCLVIECATFVTGPYASALLAHLGARVIKIESPPQGDPYRYFAPDSHYSFNFAHLNRNKESLVLDLKAAQGRNTCSELVRSADVFVENFRPGTAERLGLGYETLHALNQRLVYCSTSA